MATTISQKREKRNYQQHKAILCAFISAFLFGIANYIHAQVSGKYGLKALYPNCFSCLGLWFTYHFGRLILYKMYHLNSINHDTTYFSKKKSNYYKEDLEFDTFTYKPYYKAWLVPPQRCLIHIAITVTMTLTFQYSDRSGINSGIISSIFSTCIVYTPLIFYVLYGQRLTKQDILGCLIVIGSVVLIAFGGGHSKTDPSDSVSISVPILFALLVGLILSIQTLNFNYIVNNVKFSPVQL